MRHSEALDIIYGRPDSLLGLFCIQAADLNPQDFSAFSDDNFDEKQWVNSVMKSTEAVENREAFTAQLVMKLQMFIQEVNNALEETSHQILQNLPRVVREAELVEQEVKALSHQMAELKAEVGRVERDAENSMRTLVEMDALKTRMQAAGSSLREADNWTSLSVDVEDVFRQGDLLQISSKLQGLQQSLRILGDIPEFEDRSVELERLKDRQESMLSAPLVQSINSQDTDGARLYAKFFRDMDRSDQLKKYYHQSQKLWLLENWRRGLEEGEIVEDCSEWSWVSSRIGLFCDVLLSHWHAQCRWLGPVFPEFRPYVSLCALLADTFRSLDPSMESLLSRAINSRQEQSPIEGLIEVKKTLDRFCKSLSSAVRSSSTLHNQSDKDAVKEVVISIYAPMKPHIKDYVLLERSTLMRNLDEITSFASVELGDSIASILGQSVSRVFSAAEAAAERCNRLSNGCCLPRLVQVLHALLTTYADGVVGRITRWKEKLHPTSKTRKLEEGDDGGEADLRMSNDWTFLQQAMQALQICGEIVLRTESLDQTLVSDLLCQVRKIISENDDPFTAFDVLLLEADDASLLQKLVEKMDAASEPSVMAETARVLEKTMCEKVTRLVYDVFFHEIRTRLAKLDTMKIWSCETPSGVLSYDLPSFGVTPQEYITQIGQYLMTIPQHVEPFYQESPALKAALKRHLLPFQDGVTCSSSATEQLMEAVASGTCVAYLESLYRIPTVTQHAAKQLATDIDYLCNVLDDLGFHPSESLLAASALLRAPTVDDFRAASEGRPPTVVNVIRGMRNLPHVE